MHTAIRWNPRVVQSTTPTIAIEERNGNRDYQ
jgi:hypothetical protein